MSVRMILKERSPRLPCGSWDSLLKNSSGKPMAIRLLRWSFDYARHNSCGYASPRQNKGAPRVKTSSRFFSLSGARPSASNANFIPQGRGVPSRLRRAGSRALTNCSRRIGYSGRGRVYRSKAHTHVWHETPHAGAPEAAEASPGCPKRSGSASPRWADGPRGVIITRATSLIIPIAQPKPAGRAAAHKVASPQDGPACGVVLWPWYTCGTT